MESFLRRAMYFFSHDRLSWFVEVVWYCLYACVNGALLIAAVSFPLVFGVLYRQVPSFFSHPPVAYATLAILLTGNALLAGAFETLTVKMLNLLYAPATDLLYWLAGSYRWVMLHLLLSWMRLSMFLEYRGRPFMWSIRDLRFAPSRYRTSRYFAGYVDPYRVLPRLVPTAILVICGLPLPTVVVWLTHGVWPAILWASAICLCAATDLVDVRDRLNDRRDPLYL